MTYRSNRSHGLIHEAQGCGGAGARSRGASPGYEQLPNNRNHTNVCITKPRGNNEDRPQRTTPPSSGLHADRTAGGDHDHRDLGAVAVPRLMKTRKKHASRRRRRETSKVCSCRPTVTSWTMADRSAACRNSCRTISKRRRSPGGGEYTVEQRGDGTVKIRCANYEQKRAVLDGGKVDVTIGLKRQKITRFIRRDRLAWHHGPKGRRGRFLVQGTDRGWLSVFGRS